MNPMPTPRLVAWELTGACNLSCVHCRGASTDEVGPDELSTREALDLVDEIAGYAKPVLILSGGEPLVRDDVYRIAEYGTGKGLRVVLATNGTLVTPEVAQRLKDSGIKRVSISLDGHSPETHDGFRGVPGAFDDAMRGIKALKEVDLGFQVNTTITKRNLSEIPNIYDLAVSIGAEALHIFLLVPTGRGKDIEDEEIPPEDYERVLHWFYDKSKEASLELKATCAPHYFRIARQKQEGSELHSMTRGCLGGIGFCFISRRGEVYPCGYLPVLAGNIREQSFKEVWEDSRVFNDLRDLSQLKGKCGRCKYKEVCGGCRARAYAATGDYLDEEPYCVYRPPEVKTGEVRHG